MNREFLDLYNRELQLLNEQAREFAGEYPGIAERLGGILTERVDPMIAGLLEGAAFLAARVQLKLKHEFPEFTSNLLEQLVPHYLAPTPSVMLAKVVPAFGDKALREGRAITRGSYVDASYRQLGRQIACRYRLCSDIIVWPFELIGAEYFPSPAPLQALGAPVGSEALAGMRLTFTHRSAPRAEDEPPPTGGALKSEMQFAGCRISSLPLYLAGSESDSIALYEQLFGHCNAVYFRYLDEYGDPVVHRGPAAGCVQQVGFERADALFPNDNRIFEGFDLLREFFMFPRKFLGFNLTGLDEVTPKLKAKTVDILFAFDEVNARLAAAVRPESFAVYAAPAINLFEKSIDRIALKSSQHEYHVVPDRSHYLDFEPHRLLEVYAHFFGTPDKVPVQPLYSASLDASQRTARLFYTTRRLPRRRTGEEKRVGPSSDYVGTDMFISLSGIEGNDEVGIAELSARALCSNRHLTEHLPVGTGGADFRLLDDLTLELACVAGPTPPREPIVAQLRSRSETVHAGTIAWRLVNLLSTNHLGLVERGAGRNAQALRETLAMFAEMTDSVTERRIRAIRQVDSRPIVRRLRERSGSGIARGIEISVTIDEKAFEGAGIFLLGAILDRFFAEYSGLNNFTETVIRSVERGEVMRWPPRIGKRRRL